MPVLVVVGEAGESGHRTRVVVSNPLDHLPHLLPPLLLLLDPDLLVPGPVLPAAQVQVFTGEKPGQDQPALIPLTYLKG